MLDILHIHLDMIDQCIIDAGGFKAAAKEVELKSKTNCMEDTSFWPDFFRIKVLEYYRNIVFRQGMKWKKAYETLDSDFSKQKQNFDKRESSFTSSSFIIDNSQLYNFVCRENRIVAGRAGEGTVEAPREIQR